MNTDILNEFLDKNVEVSTTNKTYEGTLQKDPRGAYVVTPTNKYTAKRFGPAVVDQNAVIAVRAILPREESLYDDGDVESDKRDYKHMGYFQSCDTSEDNG